MLPFVLDATEREELECSELIEEVEEELRRRRSGLILVEGFDLVLDEDCLSWSLFVFRRDSRGDVLPFELDATEREELECSELIEEVEEELRRRRSGLILVEGFDLMLDEDCLSWPLFAFRRIVREESLRELVRLCGPPALLLPTLSAEVGVSDLIYLLRYEARGEGEESCLGALHVLLLFILLGMDGLLMSRRKVRFDCVQHCVYFELERQPKIACNEQSCQR